MIQLKTKQEVQYNSRSQKSGIVYFELKPVKQSDGYQCQVIDTVKVKVISKTLPTEEKPEGEDVISYYDKVLETKSIFLSNADINGIFAMVEPMLPKGLSYLEKENMLFTQAFLYFMKNDFLKDEDGNTTKDLIYGLTSNDFEIV